MAGYVGSIEIGGVYRGSLPISSIYVGAILVWQLDAPVGNIACFSGGYWDDSLPWVDTEVWKD